VKEIKENKKQPQKNKVKKTLMPHKKGESKT